MADVATLELEEWLAERLRVSDAYEALATERDLLADERDRLAAERERLTADRLADLPPPVLDTVNEVITATRRDRELAAQDRRAASNHRARNASDLAEAMEALQRAQRALRLERARSDDLAHADELKKVFLLAVAHDLRSPLAAIVGFAELISERLEDLSPDQLRDAARRISAGGQHMAIVLDNLLDMERIQGGLLEPKAVRADLVEIVRRCAGRLDLERRQLDVFPDSFEATVDPGLVERIADNLLLNAIRHTPPGSSVVVTITREHGDVLLTFADDGPGVPDDLRESIFEAFTREGSGEGHGVGLYLVRCFAELHGGRAWVQDRRGGGAAFHVLLGDIDADDD